MATTLPKQLQELTVGKLREAKYNPRAITANRLKGLQSSLNTFGDLSGVVFNIRTKTLVSGHQRLKSIKGADTKIIQKPCADKFGTVAMGHIEAKTSKGLIRIPYRAVDWEISREKAANVAANAHGGNFDKAKLALVLADIEKSKAFDIEVVGLDKLTLKSLRMPAGSESKVIPKTEFKEYGSTLADKEKHTCPKCNYRFS